jgi:DNA-binding transcriptional ArsR family regulator
MSAPVTLLASRRTSNPFLEKSFYICQMAEWSFLTNHARALVCIARDPGVRLREIAAVLDVTERRAFGIVTDLTEAGYVLKEKDGRRNRYRIQDHMALRATIGREPTIGEVLGVLVDRNTIPPRRLPRQDANPSARAPSAPTRQTRAAKHT